MSALAAFSPAGALAQEPDPPACAAAPATIVDADLTDTDRLVRELRELRREQAASCAAIVYAVGEPGHHVTVDSTLADPVHVELPPSDASPAATDVNVVSVPPAQAEAQRQLGYLRADVWGLVGLVCALPFFYALWRTVMPRA